MAQTWRARVRGLRNAGKISEALCHAAIAMISDMSDANRAERIIKGLVDQEANDDELVAIVKLVAGQSR